MTTAKAFQLQKLELNLNLLGLLLLLSCLAVKFAILR